MKAERVGNEGDTMKIVGTLNANWRDLYLEEHEDGFVAYWDKVKVIFQANGNVKLVLAER